MLLKLLSRPNIDCESVIEDSIIKSLVEIHLRSLKKRPGFVYE